MVLTTGVRRRFDRLSRRRDNETRWEDLFVGGGDTGVGVNERGDSKRSKRKPKVSSWSLWHQSGLRFQSPTLFCTDLRNVEPGAPSSSVLLSQTSVKFSPFRPPLFWMSCKRDFEPMKDSSVGRPAFVFLAMSSEGDPNIWRNGERE